MCYARHAKELNPLDLEVRTMIKRVGAMLVCGWTVVGCGSSGTPSTSYTVTLSASAEAPVCGNAGANAAGSATVTVNDTSVAISNFTWTGLSGAAEAAHLHFGDVGTSGPILFDLGVNPTPPANKTFTLYTQPSPDAPPNFLAVVAAIKAGKTYLNVHTNNCGGGEIRAQIK
jgi:hypothetical protein